MQCLEIIQQLIIAYCEPFMLCYSRSSQKRLFEWCDSRKGDE